MWNPNTRRATEVVDLMCVLKKKDEKGDLLKFKARAVACGNQQKAKAQHAGNQLVLGTFAPAARSTTFKLLCALCCVVSCLVRQFDVEAAYLQGFFDGDDASVHVRPPP
eukprot:7479-Pleurochrysis_carterae.AAC.2